MTNAFLYSTHSWNAPNTHTGRNAVTTPRFSTDCGTRICWNVFKCRFGKMPRVCEMRISIASRDTIFWQKMHVKKKFSNATYVAYPILTIWLRILRKYGEKKNRTNLKKTWRQKCIAINYIITTSTAPGGGLLITWYRQFDGALRHTKMAAPKGDAAREAGERDAAARTQRKWNTNQYTSLIQQIKKLQ